MSRACSWLSFDRFSRSSGERYHLMGKPSATTSWPPRDKHGSRCAARPHARFQELSAAAQADPESRLREP